MRSKAFLGAALGGMYLLFPGVTYPSPPGGPGAAEAPRPRPSYYSEEDLQGAKARAARYPWAARAQKAIIAAADRWRAHPYPLPEGPTGSYHDYFCPDHGVALRYDPDRPEEHVCPADNRVLRGPKLDAYWVTATVRNQLQAAVQCALAFRLTGDGAYGKAASEVLLRSAAHYRDRIAAKSPRRWMWQSLDEAVYVLDAVRTFELLSGAQALAAGETSLVLGEYLVPTARFLLGERRTINNINSWYNAAILAVGMASGDEGLVHDALGDRGGAAHGMLEQLRQGVTADGFWKEGSIDYHFYTLSSLEEQVIRAQRLPLDLSGPLATVKAMFLAPIDLADRAWVVPPTNDSSPASLERYLGHYEIAAGLFPDPKLLGFLAAAYRKTGKQRGGPEALFRGPETLPEEALPEARSRNFPEIGLGALRTTAASPEPEVYVLFKYGPHGGSHGHPDKLSVSLHGLDRVLSPDPGTAGYSVPLTSSWYRQTLSHNTVVVDRASQKPAAGKLLAFEGEGPLQRVAASAGDAYPGIAWTRGIHLSAEGIVVIEDRLEAEPGASRTFDWAWHGYGDLKVLGAPLEPLASRAEFGARSGYEVPRDVRSGRADGDLEARFEVRPETPNQPEWRKPGTAGTLRVIVLGAPGTEVFQAVAPGNPARDPVPFIVVRRRGAGASFKAVLEPVPAGREPRVTRVEALEDGLRVHTPAGSFLATLPSAGKRGG